MKIVDLTGDLSLPEDNDPPPGGGHSEEKSTPQTDPQAGPRPTFFADFLDKNRNAIPADRGFYVRLAFRPLAGPAGGTIEAVLLNAFEKLGALEPHGDRDLVFLDRSSEAWLPFSEAMTAGLVAFCRQHTFDMRRMIIVTQGPLSPTLRDGLRKAGVRARPSAIFYHHFLKRLARHYASFDLDDFGYDALKDMPPRFLCTNHKLRPHRAALLSGLELAGLMPFSLVSDLQNNAVHGKDKALRDMRRDFPALVKQAEQRGMEVADLTGSPRRLSAPFGGPSNVDSFPEKEARRSILSVVSETEAGPPGLRITEKSLKPIVYFRPFMIFGVPGALRLLHEFGFATFPDLIDETYDSAQNEEDRLRLILDELLRLRDDLGDGRRRAAFLEAAREVCAFNRAHLLSGFAEKLDRQALQALRFLMERIGRPSAL